MSRRYIHRDDNVSGYVYLIEARNSDGLYKIGLTRNPDRRIEQLNSSQSPYHLNYTKVIQVDDMASVESSLHQQFKSNGSGKNEWFRFSPNEVNQVISEMSKFENSSTNSSTVEPNGWSFQLPFQLSSPGSNSRFQVAAMGAAFCCVALAVVFPPGQRQRIASSFNQTAITATSQFDRCVVVAPLLNVRLGPGINHPLNGKPLPSGTVVNKLEEADGWIQSPQGWLAASKVRCQ